MSLCKDCVVEIYNDVSSLCRKCKHLIDLEMIPRTTDECRKNQISKPPLLAYVVISETSEHMTYHIEYFSKINAYTCCCPAFKFQHGRPVAHRTCKHIIAVRSEKFERARILGNGGIFAYKSAKTDTKTKNKTKKVLVLDI